MPRYLAYIKSNPSDLHPWWEYTYSSKEEALLKGKEILSQYEKPWVLYIDEVYRNTYQYVEINDSLALVKEDPEIKRLNNRLKDIAYDSGPSLWERGDI